MLKRLIEFLKNNYPDSNIDAYLDAKYIQLNNSQLKQIAGALNKGELNIKPASDCLLDNVIFHFGSTAILLQKDRSKAFAYQAELVWETDFHSVHSIREKSKGFYFIKFAFDNNYQIKLGKTEKHLKDQIINTEKNQQLLNKAMPILKGFMSAVSG